MAFVELENGAWINPNFIETIFKVNKSDTQWEVGLSHGEFDHIEHITDADRIRILKNAGFVKIKKEKNDE
ncbi:hypothetical protein [Lacticaseibacillus zeae]|uniref:Phage protein n=1 Tax=Lacticaseibacillus zeae subsp. silagei TaxID=3068307 RepID=A0ABD7Z9S1_LACZE|nr:MULTISPECIES: hypothetical protein [Lacticaseibacillus]MDE3315283.1 hypothetical protein [Lacticaseibacillus zeae]WLV83685.1 hypothetical protein LACZS2_000068 [Lacticaseibacillus sp. NCIMB 15475]WLV86441.1 hypothetical protein LACZS1_000068 [Lacticaseibacillus sp. NCIMB 15474]